MVFNVFSSPNHSVILHDSRLLIYYLYNCDCTNLLLLLCKKDHEFIEKNTLFRLPAGDVKRE